MAPARVASELAGPSVAADCARIFLASSVLNVSLVVASSTAGMSHTQQSEEEERRLNDRFSRALLMDLQTHGPNAWKEMRYASVGAWVTDTRRKVEEDGYGEDFVLDTIQQSYVDKHWRGLVEARAQAAPKAKPSGKRKAAPKEPTAAKKGRRSRRGNEE